jgi:hypothetical protein
MNISLRPDCGARSLLSMVQLLSTDRVAMPGAFFVVFVWIFANQKSVDGRVKGRKGLLEVDV